MASTTSLLSPHQRGRRAWLCRERHRQLLQHGWKLAGPLGPLVVGQAGPLLQGLALPDPILEPLCGLQPLERVKVIQDLPILLLLHLVRCHHLRGERVELGGEPSLRVVMQPRLGLIVVPEVHRLHSFAVLQLQLCVPLVHPLRSDAFPPGVLCGVHLLVELVGFLLGGGAHPNQLGGLRVVSGKLGLLHSVLVLEVVAKS
mmetsp:Transcript_10194/g.35219  ORF Transcript_10194/g.35219 Transcript_10194/m.35219 type:complete len:201 (-) Transcript_10194:71-673(-)